MTLPAWPDTKISPYPLNETYAHQLDDLLARSEFEQGAARQRRVFRTARVGLEMSWAFKPAEFEIFRAFADWKISGGADPFTMSVFVDSTYQTLTVSFVKGSIVPKLQGGEWIVSAKLETDALPVMSSGALNAIIGAAPGDGSLPAWPSASLAPQSLRDGFDLKLPDTVIRSDYDQGLIVQTRVFHAGPALYSVVWPMTGTQYGIFLAYRKYRIHNGEAWFTISVYRGGSYETRTVRFVKGTQRATRQGDDWLVHAQFELKDLPPGAESLLT